MIHTSPLPDVEIPDVPLSEIVLGRANDLADKPAIIDGPTGRVLTYGELDEAVRRLAGALAAHERVGDAVVLLGAAQCRRDVSGSVRAPQHATEIESAIEVMHRALGDGRFQAAYARGWSQTVDESVQYALVCAQAVAQ